jgi:hypothetical protein
MAQIREWLEYFQVTVLHHCEHVVGYRELERRGLPLFEHAGLKTPEGNLGFRIRMRRLELGWNQTELARRSLLSVKQLSRLERGHCRMRMITRIRLSRALGTSFE